ncbi:carbohydrate-binding protein [Pseudomonas sp. FSL R10-2964]|uniref:carbohydrate-binding protein n=1 Tax=Pseudomonas sp. FSL R10-2964 TaxID=2662202 RepID=UPI001295CE2E|nr:carbohydrate-binding protein [Pseudomonas sp. FSL R10-2964]MQT84002.1 carbohydrate-binding protein [Pseudomonas sp. FSL R10-2964]
MRLIKPVEITPAKLISSNVPETDYPAWSVSATYAIGDRVLLDHHIYEALAIVAAGVKPGAEVVDKDHPAKWQDRGMDNRWRMFDDKVESLTANPGTIEVRIRPGAVINSMALFNLQGKSVTITMIDPVEGEVYRKTLSLVDAGVTNWYDWFFEPIGKRTDVVVLDMPPYGSADIVLIIDAGAEVAAIGHTVIGAVKRIGTALYGTSVGINDYSRKSTDEFGNTIVIQRSFSNRAEFDVILDTSEVTRVRRLLAELRATPVVWIGEESYEATILFGFYKDFQIVFSGPTVSDCSITVEGVI